MKQHFGDLGSKFKDSFKNFDLKGMMNKNKDKDKEGETATGGNKGKGKGKGDRKKKKDKAAKKDGNEL